MIIKGHLATGEREWGEKVEREGKNASLCKRGVDKPDSAQVVCKTRSRKIAIRGVESGSSTQPDKRDCPNPQGAQRHNRSPTRGAGKTAETVSIRDRGAKGKNLRTGKGKRKVDPRAEVKRRQIGANTLRPAVSGWPSLSPLTAAPPLAFLGRA